MKVTQTQVDGVEIFELDGELDFHTSPELREQLQVVLQNHIEKIVINLSKVAYIDSSGLATFVELLQKTKSYGGKLVLTELAPAVRSVFEIAKLDKVFSLATSQDEALQLVAQ